MPLNSNDRLRLLTEEAAQMIFDMEEHGSRDCEARLAAWLATSSDHVDAYLRTRVALWKFDEIDAACEAAKKRVAGNTAVPPALAPVMSLPWHSARGPRRAGLRPWLATAATVTIVGVLAFEHLSSGEVRPTGEHTAPPVTEVTIYDSPGFIRPAANSLLRLGIRSRVEVRNRADRHGQEVALLRGEVFFSGRHDTQNPLRVVSGAASLAILGTQFEVQRVGERTRVTVSEGAVRLEACADPTPAPQFTPAHDSPTAATLTAGETATFDDKDCGSALRVEKLDLRHPIKEAVFTKDEKTIEFRDATVGEALELLNRANPDVLVVADSSLQERRFWGRFPANPEEFIHLLQQVYRIQAQRSTVADGGTLINLTTAR